MVDAIAREVYLQAPFDSDDFKDLNEATKRWRRAKAVNFLRAARDAGYETAPKGRLAMAERLLRAVLGVSELRRSLRRVDGAGWWDTSHSSIPVTPTEFYYLRSLGEEGDSHE